MEIRGYPIWPVIKKTAQDVWKDNILTIAAAVAYYFFFSLFPLLLFAAPIVGLVGNKQQLVTWILDRLAASVPPDAFEPLAAVANQVVYAPNAPGLISIGAVLTAYSASNIFGSLMGALNIAYHVKTDRRPWWKQRLIQLGMVVVVGGLTTVAATVMTGGPNIVDAVAKAVDMPSTAKWVWMLLQYPVSFGFLVLALWIVYYVLPDVTPHRGRILVGAVTAAILWVAATVLFRGYVVRFNQFNKAYGTIGAVLLLLSWMYYSMVVILAGGELNSELDEWVRASPASAGVTPVD